MCSLGSSAPCSWLWSSHGGSCRCIWSLAGWTDLEITRSQMVLKDLDIAALLRHRVHRGQRSQDQAPDRGQRGLSAGQGAWTGGPVSTGTKSRSGRRLQGPAETSKVEAVGSFNLPPSLSLSPRDVGPGGQLASPSPRAHRERMLRRRPSVHEPAGRSTMAALLLTSLPLTGRCSCTEGRSHPASRGQHAGDPALGLPVHVVVVLCHSKGTEGLTRHTLTPRHPPQTRSHPKSHPQPDTLTPTPRHTQTHPHPQPDTLTPSHPHGDTRSHSHPTLIPRHTPTLTSRHVHTHRQTHTQKHPDTPRHAHTQAHPHRDTRSHSHPDTLTPTATLTARHT